VSSRRGITLVELMIVVAIVSIIGVGLVNLIRISMNIWWAGGVKVELQHYAQEAMFWISKDLRSAKASSVGNVGYNSGFEIPLDSNLPSGDPYGWQSPLPAGVARISSNDPNLKSGFYGMKLTNSGATVNYESEVATFSMTGTYTLSCWIKSDGPAEVRLLQDTGFDFIPAVSTGCATGSLYWQHLSITTSKAAGTKFKIRLTNANAGGTSYFDDVGIAPLKVEFNPSDPPGYFTYEKYTGLKINAWRLYYDPATRNLYRQVFDGLTWVTQSPDPLCQDVQAVVISNNEQTNFMVSLTLSKPVRAGKIEEYRVDNSITPLVP